MLTTHRHPLLALGVVGLCACAEADPDDVSPQPQLAFALEAADAPCTFSQVVAPQTYDTTERLGVSGDGRVFFIGTRPVQGGDSKSWLAEISLDANGKARASDLLAGTLAGTLDGKLGGAPAGDACVFSGMAARGSLIYAGCYAADGRVALVQVDLTQNSVRAADFSSCNAETPTSPCKTLDLYPNGMAIDRRGRVYTSSMLAHVSGVEEGATIVQIEVGPHPQEPQKLNFRHRAWLKSDFISDGFAPNGVQIQNDSLYYAAGANINVVPILESGKAGRQRVQYHGIFLTYIDDFAVNDRSFVAARTLPGDLAELSAPNLFGISRVVGTCGLPGGAIPSSVLRMPATVSAASVFPAGTLLVTSFFGGGLYTLNRLR